MSSSRHPRSWSLRTRIIAEQMALLTLVCLIIGVVTMVALRDFQISKLDEQLQFASNRSSEARGDRPRPNGVPRPNGTGIGDRNPLSAPGQAPGTLSATVDDGALVQALRLTPDRGDQETIPDEARPQLIAFQADAKPDSVTLEGLGEYRLIATRTPTGEVLITGLPLTQVNATVVQLGFVLGGVALAGLLIAALAGAFIVRRTLLPLQRVAGIATRVSELPLHEGEVALAVRVPKRDSNPNTEVGQVGLALNRMLGHIGNALTARHATETRVRQFVADASHELRTPLAAIRGYAELTRRSKAEVPPEIAHAMSRVESEADRMTVLVQDLLLLARLDAGRPLDDTEVDLTRLVLDAVSDTRISAQNHNWQLELPAEPVTVRGDADRLHQVLTNLLTNARTHTPPGTTVTTGLSVSPAHGVELTVTDNGPGINPELLPNVFERFARGDSSRSRAAGSTGLGLSIVSAVVTSHGGTVGVASEPGKTRFTVRLPIRR
ncbi:ATP-binding protein [Umezawaea sp. Da 62-37]|uniref:sensor histidine kinase n=1 Tax=Umezawaea sp. Da 62-37 TaxID=3075927 RepID=UPI0028F74F12|nr:ATP-binding protein [Umezawaea sp. Da 62-37]WNV89231.1 ATP-binding protein [Umezawaea sp. Da 62-37]